MFFSVVGFVGSLLLPALGLAQFEKTTKPVTVLSFFFFFAAFALTERMTRFAASRTQRLTKALDEGAALVRQGKYAEAAEFYTRLAQKELKNNEWYFAFYCRNAFQMWIKAKEPHKALLEAGKVLSVYVMNNGRLMKYNSGDEVEKLTSMVERFFRGGLYRGRGVPGR